MIKYKSNLLLLFGSKAGKYLCCHKASCLEPLSYCSFRAHNCKETFTIMTMGQMTGTRPPSCHIPRQLSIYLSVDGKMLVISATLQK